MKGYRELVQRLVVIKRQGWVTTRRQGNTGIGKTLEDLLGIQENNIPGPNGRRIELKSVRKNAKSMLTLFTKSPEPAKANAVLLERYGYPSIKEMEGRSFIQRSMLLNTTGSKGKLVLRLS